MADISNKTVGTIIGIALIVSMAGLFTMPNSLFSFTGHGTEGQARINISRSAQLNVTQYVIDFGNGTVESSKINCTLSSEDFELQANADPLNCWTGSGALSGGFVIENVGNVALNVTLDATKNGTINSTKQNTFWGAGNSTYLWKCKGNGTILLTTYGPIYNQTALPCVGNLAPTIGSDVFNLHINITFPDYVFGLKNDTITFTASEA